MLLHEDITKTKEIKNKYGLTGKQRKKQKSVSRCKTTKACKRYAELNKKKTNALT